MAITPLAAMPQQVAAQVVPARRLPRHLLQRLRVVSSTSLRHLHVDRDEQVALGAVAAGRAPAAHRGTSARWACPAGCAAVTGWPRWIGTLISAPSAASGKVTGTVIVRLSPERPNTLCGVTCTTTYRSPAGPPFSPGAPLPLSRIRCPSPTPAGMRAWIVRVLCARPLP